MIIKKKMKKMVPMTQMLINIALCDEFSFDHVDLSFRSPEVVQPVKESQCCHSHEQLNRQPAPYDGN